MNKIIKLFAVLAVLPLSLSATGLSFQTINPAVGDVLTSTSTELPLSTSLRFGTLGANLDFSGAAGFATYSDFNSAFTSVITATVTEATPNNFNASILAGGLAANTNLWMLVDDGVEQGVFYAGITPGLGQLVVTPQTIALGTGGAAIAIGSSSGNDLNLVPEPSSFALLAGCFGLAWVMVRRRA